MPKRFTAFITLLARLRRVRTDCYTSEIRMRIWDQVIGSMFGDSPADGLRKWKKVFCLRVSRPSRTLNPILPGDKQGYWRSHEIGNRCSIRLYIVFSVVFGGMLDQLWARERR